MKTARHLLLTLFGSMLIVILSMTGCSDVPYTGPIITVDRVDTYLNAIGNDTLCLKDGFDAVCVKLDLDKIEIDSSDIGYTPTVHVHPENIAYVFEYQGNPILRAKRTMDTSAIVQRLEDEGKVKNLPSSGNNLNVATIPEGWIIEIYSTAPMNVRVVEGLTIGTNTQKDLRISKQTKMDDGVQFTVDTTIPEITVQVRGLIPGNTATFHISANDINSNDNTNILKLQPIQ